MQNNFFLFLIHWTWIAYRLSLDKLPQNFSKKFFKLFHKKVLSGQMYKRIFKILSSRSIDFEFFLQFYPQLLSYQIWIARLSGSKFKWNLLRRVVIHEGVSWIANWALKFGWNYFGLWCSFYQPAEGCISNFWRSLRLKLCFSYHF